MLTLNMQDEHIKNKTKHVQFIDIETSLIDARIFRPGTQHVAAMQANNYTRLLTAAGGSMYDLYTKKRKGVWSVSNHHNKERFALDPLDDTHVMEHLWKKLDSCDVMVAHNARFDESWILGRCLQLGWPLPSKFSTICTLRGLYKYHFTSKKLDKLSQQLLGTQKIATQFDLWNRCSNGEVSAFKEMLRYNEGDVYDTLFLVYMRTCMYFPDYAVDLVDYEREIPQCKVTGETLDVTGDVWVNRKNGCEYELYHNPTYNITYRDRYNTNSSKAGKGLIRHHT